MDTTTSQLRLFTPVGIGPIRLGHRVVMAPLTRLRSDQPGDVPNDLMAEYYGQRATDGGLIITESAEITPDASAYQGAPGIYCDAQVAGWRKVTSAVHAKGGYIFLQLWHSGRVSHVDLTGGVTPVGPSAVPTDGILVFTAKGPLTATPNRALETEEIPGIVEQYRRAAEKAKAAGLDGIEILAAGGYLLDQFLQDGANKRTDQYGGSPANRSRLLLEVIETVSAVWNPNRIGVRLSPSGTFNSISDSNPHELFDYVAEALNQFGLAYLHIIEPRVRGGENLTHGQPVAAARLRRIFTGTIIAAGGFDPQGATAIVEAGNADLVAFGRHFIANPDLPKRIELGLPLNAYDRATFYGGDHRGYIDYPFYEKTGVASERNHKVFKSPARTLTITEKENISDKQAQPLLEPCVLGDLPLRNRAVMAPLTRTRAENPGHAPTELMRDYYVQRASAGLIISEGTWVSEDGQGWYGAPGIYNQEQGAAWKMITEAVHAAGGRIFAQLWHQGSVSLPEFFSDGRPPLAPSAINPLQPVHVGGGQTRMSGVPREMTRADIKQTVADFRNAARIAQESGFDGVQIQGGFVYLFQQFLHETTNQRTDEYGGTVENRARFLFEVLDAVLEVWPSQRVGIKAGPMTNEVGAFKSLPSTLSTSEYVYERLNGYNLSHILLMRQMTDLTGTPLASLAGDGVIHHFRKRYKGTLILNVGIEPQHGNELLREGLGDLIAFGRPFIANPDLVERIRRNAPFNEQRPSGYYGSSPIGYTDYSYLPAQG